MKMLIIFATELEVSHGYIKLLIAPIKIKNPHICCLGTELGVMRRMLVSRVAS